MTPIYRLNGEYFGFVSAGNIYAGDGTYFGWLDGEHAWYRTGHHLGEIVDDTYILRRAGGRTRTHRAPRTAVNRHRNVPRSGAPD